MAKGRAVAWRIADNAKIRAGARRRSPARPTTIAPVNARARADAGARDHWPLASAICVAVLPRPVPARRHRRSAATMRSIPMSAPAGKAAVSAGRIAWTSAKKTTSSARMTARRIGRHAWSSVPTMSAVRPRSSPTSQIHPASASPVIPPATAPSFPAGMTMSPCGEGSSPISLPTRTATNVPRARRSTTASAARDRAAARTATSIPLMYACRPGRSCATTSTATTGTRIRRSLMISSFPRSSTVRWVTPGFPAPTTAPSRPGRTRTATRTSPPATRCAIPTAASSPGTGQRRAAACRGEATPEEETASVPCTSAASGTPASRRRARWA